MGGLLSWRQRLWPKHLEVMVPVAFVATLVLVAAVYLLLDFHRMRSGVVQRYQTQALGLAQWTDRNLDRLVGQVRATIHTKDLCSSQGDSGLSRLLGTVPVARLEIQGRTGDACAWRSASALDDLCAGVQERDPVRIPLDLGDGRRLLLDLNGACLFGAVVPPEAEEGVRHTLLSASSNGERQAQSDDATDGSVWSLLVSPVLLRVRSPKWPVVVVINVPESSLVHQWLSTLPLQLGLISGLGIALWFGPMTLVRRRLSVEGQVRTALRRGEFFLAYLPLVDVASRNWVGAEALLRWRHGRYGVLMPNAFIPWIETSPLIHDTTRWVMIQAARDLDHMSQRVPDFSLAVNVPPVQFTDRRLVQMADEAFGTRPLALCQVVFELTERQALDYDAPALGEVLSDLRDRGAQIAVDDFGVGFSNLALLGMIEVDFVKIDRSFLREEAWAEPHMLEAMVPLLRDLGVLIIAEGIETERQLDRIRDCGIRLAQGFLFSRPIEIEALLAGLPVTVPRARPA
jgi:EAL domain-containing protein (putative c-di-GMP-specific phosphodiesterase class I)